MNVSKNLQPLFCAAVLVAAALSAQAQPPTAQAQPAATAEVKPPAKPWYDNVKLSGFVFGDAYGVLAHHDPTIEDANGFWIRRAFLTFDYTIAEAWSARMRLEANSPGDWQTNVKLEPFIKDAYLAWKSAGHELYLGISPSPTWDFTESFWGYRAIEKTPIDLYRMGSARDLGVGYRGKAGGDKIFIHAVIGNGSAEGAETNEGKKAMVSLRFQPTAAVVVEVYGDFEDRPGATDRTTYDAFVGFKGSASRYALQYASQDRDVVGGPSQTLAVGSVFGVWDLGDKSSVIARYDRSFDANPEADKIPYLPIAKDVEFDLAILGWDYKLQKKISLIPNLEYVMYRDRDGVTAPDDGIVGKLTLFFQF